MQLVKTQIDFLLIKMSSKKWVDITLKINVFGDYKLAFAEAKDFE